VLFKCFRWSRAAAQDEADLRVKRARSPYLGFAKTSGQLESGAALVVGQTHAGALRDQPVYKLCVIVFHGIVQWCVAQAVLHVHVLRAELQVARLEDPKAVLLRGDEQLALLELRRLAARFAAVILAILAPKLVVAALLLSVPPALR